jgi:hypothetical protein
MKVRSLKHRLKNLSLVVTERNVSLLFSEELDTEHYDVLLQIEEKS